MLRCWILSACLATGCLYHPVYEGVGCDSQGRCPDGYRCVWIDDRAVCVEEGAGQDARDAGPGDGDAGSDHSEAGDPDESGDPGIPDAGDPGGDPGPVDAGPVCGDARVTGDEVCDDGVNDGSYGGCMPDCRAFGPFCGDGRINGPEECDQSDHGQVTCRTLGYLAGDLACDAGCRLDAAGCRCPHYRRLLVESGYVPGNEDLEDFPVLVTLQGDYLRQAGDGGQVLSPEGHDIVFRLPDSADRLAHELNFYTSQPAAGSLSAWVRLPTLYAGRDTSFFICFGADWTAGSTEDPAGVWSPDHEGVWHLDEASGIALDSTGNRLDGQFEGDLPDSRTGVVGRAHHFDGTGDQIRVGQHAALDVTQAITLSTWIRAENRNQQFRLIGKWFSNGVDWSYALYAKSAEGFRLWNGFNFIELTDWSGEVGNNVWSHLAATYDGTTARVFIDGVPVGQQDAANTIAVTGNDLLIGNDGYDNHLFQGLMDEVRISRVARSPAWIAAGYHNQIDPASFCRVAP